MIFNVVKVLFPAIFSFGIGIAITPWLTGIMYKHKMWKTASRSKDNPHAMSADFQKIHNEAGEKTTPRVGGILIWISVLAVVFVLSVLSYFYPTSISTKLNFLSKNQTLLPFMALIFASVIGLIDDILQIYGKTLQMSEGISRKMRILVVLLIGAIGAWWFYFKLDVLSIHIPFGGDLNLGILFIPFFMFVVLAVFSSSVIDGIDGLSAGVLSSAYAAYGIISFAQNQIDIAAFCAVIIGGLMAFLWFNIPPARFYMGETGMLGLTVTLAIVAFLTREVVLLPLIALPLFATSISSAIQMFSKKYFHYKVFRIAPLHHHFEALGWPSYKVTMRYWIISIICAILGSIIAIVGKHF